MSALAASAKGASFLILLQVASRAFTFIVNQILLRFLSPELLGLSSQLELYSITVLYFARESIRVAVQRNPDQSQVVVNLAYISIFSGIPLAYILAKLYLRAELPPVPYFTESLGIYGFSCIIELLSEPAFVAAQQKLLYKVRASTEALATLTRCLATCGAAFWASRSGLDIGVLPFALGQLAYSSIILKAYVLQLWSVSSRGNFSLLPKRLASDKNDRYILGFFSQTLSKLSISLLVQNSFKFILTQGDGILIAALTSLRDQGAYALASNYGGLVARMLFQPIEESSRNMFAKTCAADPSTGKASKTGLRESKSLLQNILKLYNIISLLALCIGPTVAPLLLRIVAGSKWADTGAGEVLSTYCFYIPFLAINGLTEAFVAAVATNSELHTQSVLMGVFFAGFAGASYLFLHVWQMGALGLVYANCVNMLLRIIFNLNFIKSFFKRNEDSFGFSSTLPSGPSIAAGVAVASILRSPMQLWDTNSFLVNLVCTGVISGILGVLLLYFERDYIIYCYRTLRPQRLQNTRPSEKKK
ncbi:Chitobiosyldiphosphodolichol beta-mannosyltransferase [Venturia inaequalis]|uniref:Man(5)GlcNAc(2)-PP-dolichol translocation protein RFT1 n=1 Tax=Venturia inaequalis TaxID=5025 RepID=A0A8H3YZM9_VENIN|nr:hypothetical protein EG327_008436 [Venturia inaequalis]RDI77393.1 Chitobiosyldiphosphodolichol beta-mannosyltransferase [Venturia inaequalis]